MIPSPIHFAKSTQRRRLQLGNLSMLTQVARPLAGAGSCPRPLVFISFRYSCVPSRPALFGWLTPPRKGFEHCLLGRGSRQWPTMTAALWQLTWRQGSWQLMYVALAGRAAPWQSVDLLAPTNPLAAAKSFLHNALCVSLPWAKLLAASCSWQPPLAGANPSSSWQPPSL